MKITSKKTDDLTKILTLEVEASDYEAARKKKLAEMQRKAEVPGFRKGKVPASLIEKWYGPSALGDAVNGVVGEAVQKYVTEKKLNLIGEPLPLEEEKEQEWKAGNDFKFHFELAETPEFALELNAADEVLSYNINVTEAEKKKLIDGYKKQQEAMAKAAEESKKEDKGESVPDAPKALTDEELTRKVDEQLAAEYAEASRFKLEKDIRDYCVRKAGIKLPEKFLRRWLIAVNEGKFTEEQIDKDFEGFLADYRWQLIMADLTKKFNIKIDEKDLKEEAKNFARYQYAMYGMMDVPEDALESFAGNMLKDQSNLQRLVENVQAKKVIDAVKEKITVKSKKISAEKFREMK